jgi:hypothetical protein
MKLIALSVIAALACACASSPTPTVASTQAAPVSTSQAVDWHARVEADRQLTEQMNVARERLTYQRSVDKIAAQFSDEELQLQMCYQVHTDHSAYCFTFLRKLCEEDTVIDSRGDSHKKEFCNRSYLDYHNPDIKRKY